MAAVLQRRDAGSWESQAGKVKSTDLNQISKGCLQHMELHLNK